MAEEYTTLWGRLPSNPKLGSTQPPHYRHVIATLLLRLGVDKHIAHWIRCKLSYPDCNTTQVFTHISHYGGNFKASILSRL